MNTGVFFQELEIINTHGGSNLNICEYIFPKIVRILSEEK